MFSKRHKAKNESQLDGVRLITYFESKNPISEQVRTVRTNIEFAAATLDEFKVLMVTSPEMGDGKSTVSANLAVTWAQAGKKVLLIDADMRRPTAHKTFNQTNTDGLSTLLANDKAPDQVINEAFVENLSVLTSGPVPPNPTELLGSKRMVRLIEWAREHYDLVLLDATPVLAVADVQVTLPIVDGVALVVMMEKTMKANIKRTLELINMTQTKVLGVIPRIKKARKAEGYGYGYGYGYGVEK